MDFASPLNRKALRRFYEPIVLTKALTDISQETGSSRTPESTEPANTEKARFCSFVNKLANVCDRQKGGNTVTSFAVLEHENGIMYIFASNKASNTALKDTEEFVIELLEKVSGVSDLEQSEKAKETSAIQRLILTFNRPRVEIYLRALQGDISLCLEACKDRTDSETLALKEGLESLNDSIIDMNLKYVKDSEYLASCFKCLRAISASFSSTTRIHELINERARQGRMPGMRSLECWSDLRHHVSRLFFYEHATLEFVKAEREWPELFREVSVCSLPSSGLDPNPLGKKSQSACNIIGRMTREEEEISSFRGLAQELQAFDLDGRIQKQCEKSTFRPFVHCEILVLDWVYTNPQAVNYQFFRGFKYIGSSKPTCKLCDYYFRAHPSRIEARPTHGNLYPNWRFPDVLKINGDAAIKQRQGIYNSMRLSVCSDGLRIIKDKRSMWKKYDSNTYPVLSARQTDVQTEASVDDLEEQLRAELSLRSSPEFEDMEGPVSDDEDGGASLI